MHPVVEKLIEKKYDAQKSKEWLSLRGTMLTASDAATAIGDNPYEKPNGLILKKCGFNKFSGNAATRWGEKYEDEAREIYEEKYNEKAHELGLVQHPNYCWLGGSADGVCESGKLIEIKCPMRRKIIPGEIPHHYIAQVQLLMEILNLEECDFIQYMPEDLTWPKPPVFEVVNIKRDREWFEEKLPIMDELWKRVIWYREDITRCEDLHPKKRNIKKREKKVPDYTNIPSDDDYNSDHEEGDLNIELL